MTESIPERTMDRSAKHGDLAALLARVEAAAGPDRELDADLCVAMVYPGEFPEGLEPGWTAYLARSHVSDRIMVRVRHVDGEDGPLLSWPRPHLTASLDAALALVERCGWRVHGLDASIRDHHAWTLCRSSEVPNDGMDYASAAHADIRLALLAALLKALIAEAASPE
jgi:hypothetical protein